jgi:hypothetical protein
MSNLELGKGPVSLCLAENQNHESEPAACRPVGIMNAILQWAAEAT